MRRALGSVIACALLFALVPAGAFAAPQPSAALASAWKTATEPQARTKAPRDRNRVASVITPAAADDNVPGVALPMSPVADAMDYDTDWDDVYSVYLEAGEVLNLYVDGAFDADLYIYGPGTTDVNSDPWLDAANSESYTESLSFMAPAAGTYYVDVYDAWGAGSYMLTWSITSGGTGGDAGTIDDSITSFDGTDGFGSNLYTFNLLPGQRFTASLSATDGEHLCFWDPDMVDNDFFHSAQGYLGVHGEMPNTWATDEIDFVCPPDGGGAYVLEVGGWDGMAGGPYTVDWQITDAPPGLHRLSGSSRYATSQMISSRSFNHADTAIIATGANFADALAASALAGVYDAPILLTDPRGLSVETLIELARLNVSNVIIVGGRTAVSMQVEADLDFLGYSWERLAGSSRYQTARMIADRVIAQGGNTGSVFVVRGDSFADALAVSPYAYNQDIPVLLTPSTSLDAGAKDFILDNKTLNAYVIGGTSAVSDGVFQQLYLPAAGPCAPQRISGSGRYATAVNVANFAIDNLWADSDYIGVATGLNFPDALGGGAAAGVQGGILLLTDPKTLSTPTKQMIIDAGGPDGDPGEIAIYGGFGAVSASVEAQIDSNLVGTPAP